MKNTKLIYVFLLLTLLNNSCNFFGSKEYFNSGFIKEKYKNQALDIFIETLIQNPNNLESTIRSSKYYDYRITKIFPTNSYMYNWLVDYLNKCKINSYIFEDSYIFNVNDIDKVDEFTTARKYLEIDSLITMNISKVANIHLQLKDNKSGVNKKKNSIIFTFYINSDENIILGTIFPKYWDPF